MALTHFNSDWEKVYNKATIVFAKDINATKKTDKNLGLFLDEMLDDVQRPLDVVSAMVAIDKIDLAGGSPKEIAALPGNVKLFRAAMDKFETARTKYVKALDEALKLQPSMKDKNGLIVPKPIKDGFPDTYRQLKILKTEIEAIFARAGNELAGGENKEKSEKISAEKNKAQAKIKGSSEEDNLKIKAIQEEAAMKQFLIAFGTSFKSSMAKGAAVIQRIKASPDVATYNKEMNNGGRDISQNLVNIAKLKANPKFESSPLAKKLPDPAALAKEIVPFANGDQRSLDSTATAEDVKKHLAEFTQLYKRIAITYADVIAGKIN